MEETRTMTDRSLCEQINPRPVSTWLACLPALPFVRVGIAVDEAELGMAGLTLHLRVPGVTQHQLPTARFGALAEAAVTTIR